MPVWPFRRSRAATDAAQLVEAVQAASRRAVFFGPGRVPDTLQGRLEFLTLNAVVVLLRLRREPGAEPLAQDFTDQLFRSLDSGLRESGVGDLSVPKKMRSLAGDFYGRVGAYGDALARADTEALTAAIARNIGPDFAGQLARYAQSAAAQQGEAPLENLFVVAGWPSPPEA